MFEGAIKDWKFVVSFIVASIVFWLLEFAYQFYLLVPGQLNVSLVRSFALSGATLFSAALLSSALMRWKPAWARYWNVRRALGVVGTAFIALHVVSVIQFLYLGGVFAPFFSLNPFENPIVFGLLALSFFLALALTSTDWAVRTMRVWWKRLHRLVYLAYLFAVLHCTTVNPPILFNPAGYLLLLMAALALIGELYWFYRISKKRKFQSMEFKVGVGMIVLWIVFSYFAYVA